MSKYIYLRVFGNIYERLLFKILSTKASTILAAADENEIKIKKHNYRNLKLTIHSFPTRFNSQLFCVKDKLKMRTQLSKSFNISIKDTIFISVGRIVFIKGWPLLVDSFRYVLKTHKNCQLIFIGDGEESEKLASYCHDEINKGIILMVGFQSSEIISAFLNAADVFISGSYVEGWPTSIVEALACGKSIVTTKVSGVSDMIQEGINGYIIEDRNTAIFGEKMLNAINLESPNSTSISLSKKYSNTTLKNDLNNIWLNGVDQKHN